MRIRSFAVALLAVAVLLLSARAEARHAKFLGPHPIASRFGGGYCYIESPHLHVYMPDRQSLYQQVGDEWVFTGDPTPFGYDGDKHVFYGHHPVITVGAQPVYCYLNGPHFHAFAAPEIPDYRMQNGVAFYVGAFPPEYAKVRHERVRVVNAEYRPFVSFRPVVQVAPPPEWHGEVYVAPPAVPSVMVQAPAVDVRFGGPSAVVQVPPPPGVHVEISAPGVYVAPPRPPTIVVGAPPAVYVGPPGFGGGRREWRRGEHDEGDEREHERHDNGKHRGWDKHHGRGDD